MTRTRPWIAAFLLAAALEAPAQQAERYPLGRAKVEDNRQASDLYDRALGLLKASRWREGVEKLIELQDQYGDRLIRQGDGGQFLSARALVVKLSRELPADGLAAYRAAIDSRIERRLDNARTAKDYRAILRDAPMATLSGEAARRLIDLLWDDGDIPGAASACEMFLALPGRSSNADAAARLAVALGALNDREGLAALEARLADRLDAAVLVRGKPSTLRATLESARRRLRAEHDAPPAWAEWRTFGGSPSRDRLAPALRSIPPADATHDLEPSAVRRADQRIQRFGETPMVETEERRLVLPAAADGILVVNEGHRAWATDLVGGMARKLWEYGNGDDGVLSPDRVMAEERVVNAVTLDGGRAWFCVATGEQKHQDELGWLMVIYPIPFRALVCVEAATGRLLWRRGGNDKAKDLEGRLSYHGAPVVSGNRLYSGATHWKTATDQVDHYIVCLDASTGEMIWHRQLCSGIQELNLFNNNTRESVGSSLTLSRDRLYYCSNLGVAACVDASDGGVLWARRYPAFETQPVTDPYDLPRQPMYWANNPILAWSNPKDGSTFVLLTPLDSPYLLCLSGEDGSILWKYSCFRDGETPDVHYRRPVYLRHLLGVREGVVYLSGTELVALEVPSMKRAMHRAEVKPGHPAGRGLVAADGIYVPTTSHLLRFSLKTDAEDGKQAWRWDDPSRMPGNLLIVDGALVTAGSERLTIFSDVQRTRSLLDSEIARNPSSAYLRYRLALTHLQSGDAAQAEAALKAALALAEDRDNAASRAVAEACRRALFRARLSAAARLRAEDPAKAAAEYRRALDFAPSADAKVEALFAEARAWAESGRAERAVGCFDEALDRHGDLVRGGEPVSAAVKREIGAHLARHGREAYASLEARARELHEKARRSGDAAALQAVINRFPNALVVEEASLAIGQVRSAERDWAGACEAFSAFLRAYPESAGAPQAMAEMALAYEARKMTALAGSTLRRLRRVYPGAEVRVEGGAIAAKAFADARLARPEYQALETGAKPPLLEFPADNPWRWDVAVGQSATLLVPEGAVPWSCAPVVVLAGGTVSVADAKTGKALWRGPAPRAARWAAWSGGLLVVGGDGAFHAYRENGERAWTATVEGTTLYAAREGEGAVLFAMRDAAGTGSFLAALDSSTGTVTWKNPMQANQHLTEFWLTSDGVAWRTRDGLSILVADRETGAMRHRFTLVATRIYQAGADRLLALTRANQLQLVDAGTGKTGWTHALEGLLSQESLQVRGGTVAFITNSAGGYRLRSLDLDSGKLTADAALGNVHFRWLLSDGERAFIAGKSTEEPNGVVASAYSLRTGERLWQTPLDPEISSVFPLVNSRDHVLLNCPVFSQEVRKWTPIVIGLEKKTGAESGRIKGKPTPTPTYVVETAPGRILLSQDGSVEGFGR
jgi:outer membrane protein assembly factor BamB/outer membrane protein assembly factor BamD (BamD/ComL family)